MPFMYYGMPNSITPKVYDKIKNLYWILAPTDGSPASPYAWAMGKDAPSILINGMEWRRPTYDETVERQTRYDLSPLEFLAYVDSHSDAFHQLQKDGWRISHEFDNEGNLPDS